MHQRELVFSDDIRGIAGSADRLLEIYGPVKYEVLAWNSPFCSFRQNWHELQTKGIDVVRLHGRTGGNGSWDQPTDQLKLWLAEPLIVSTPELVHLYADKVSSLLVHQPEAVNPNNAQALARNKQRLLHVENHPSPGNTVDTAKTVLNLQEQGFKVRMMFDLAHYLRELVPGLTGAEQWHETRWALNWLLQLKDHDDQPMGIDMHLPIGSLELDSWPMALRTRYHYGELARMIDGRVQQVTIENQQQSLGHAAGTSRRSARFIRDWTARQLEPIFDSGLIGW